MTFQWECVFYLLRGKRTLHFFTWTHVIYWNSFCHCPSWICGIISCSSWPFNFLPSPWRFPTHQKLTCSLGFEQIDTFKKPGLTPKFLIELAIKLTVGTPFEMKMINYKVFWIFLLYMSYIVLPSVFPATTHFCMCLWCLLAFQPAQLHRRCVPWAPSCRTPCCPMSHGRGWQNLEESHAIHCGLFSSKEISCGKPNAIKTYHVAMWRWIFVQTLCRKSLGLAWGDWGHWVYHIASSHDSFRFFCNESMLSNVPQAGLIDWFPKQLIWIIWPMAPKIMPDGYRSQNG